MPTDPCIDDRCTRGLNRLGQLNHLFMGGSIGDQINHRQTINNDEIRANRRARTLHNFNRQSHPIFVRPAPTIRTFVCVGHKELVNKIPLGPHDFDTVITCGFCTLRCRHNIADLFFNAFFIQFLGWKGRNG